MWPRQTNAQDVPKLRYKDGKFVLTHESAGGSCGIAKGQTKFSRFDQRHNLRSQSNAKVSGKPLRLHMEALSFAMPDADGHHHTVARITQTR